MKQRILKSLIRREWNIRHTKPRFIKSAAYAPRGYCQIINRNIIRELIKELRNEIGVLK